MASPSETLREPTAKLIMVMIWTCRRATEIDDVRKLLLEIFFFVCLSELPCSFYKKASREYEIRSHGDWRVPLSFSKHNSIACIPCVLTRRSVVHLTGALLPFWSTYSCCTRAPERYMFDHNHAAGWCHWLSSDLARKLTERKEWDRCGLWMNACVYYIAFISSLPYCLNMLAIMAFPSRLEVLQQQRAQEQEPLHSCSQGTNAAL